MHVTNMILEVKTEVESHGAMWTRYLPFAVVVNEISMSLIRVSSREYPRADGAFEPLMSEADMFVEFGLRVVTLFAAKTVKTSVVGRLRWIQFRSFLRNPGSARF